MTATGSTDFELATELINNRNSRVTRIFCANFLVNQSAGVWT